MVTVDRTGRLVSSRMTQGREAGVSGPETAAARLYACDMAPALNTLVGGASKVFESSYVQVHEAIRALVKRAIKSGDIRKDLDPLDLLRSLVGVSNVASILTGSRAPGDWWTSSSAGRDQSNSHEMCMHAHWYDGTAGSGGRYRCRHPVVCSARQRECIWPASTSNP